MAKEGRKRVLGWRSVLKLGSGLGTKIRFFYIKKHVLKKREQLFWFSQEANSTGKGVTQNLTGQPHGSLPFSSQWMDIFRLSEGLC